MTDDEKHILRMVRQEGGFEIIAMSDSTSLGWTSFRLLATRRKLNCLFKIIAAYLLLLRNTFLTRTRNQVPILNETQIELGFPFLQAREI